MNEHICRATEALIAEGTLFDRLKRAHIEFELALIPIEECPAELLKRAISLRAKLNTIDGLSKDELHEVAREVVEFDRSLSVVTSLEDS